MWNQQWGVQHVKCLGSAFPRKNWDNPFVTNINRSVVTDLPRKKRYGKPDAVTAARMGRRERKGHAQEKTQKRRCRR